VSRHHHIAGLPEWADDATAAEADRGKTMNVPSLVIMDAFGTAIEAVAAGEENQQTVSLLDVVSAALAGDDQLADARRVIMEVTLGIALDGRAAPDDAQTLRKAYRFIDRVLDDRAQDKEDWGD
jgi:hypothetical protein